MKKYKKNGIVWGKVVWKKCRNSKDMERE